MQPVSVRCRSPRTATTIAMEERNRNRNRNTEREHAGTCARTRTQHGWLAAPAPPLTDSQTAAPPSLPPFASLRFHRRHLFTALPEHRTLDTTTLSSVSHHRSHGCAHLRTRQSGHAAAARQSQSQSPQPPSHSALWPRATRALPQQQQFQATDLFVCAVLRCAGVGFAAGGPLSRCVMSCALLCALASRALFRCVRCSAVCAGLGSASGPHRTLVLRRSRAQVHELGRSATSAARMGVQVGRGEHSTRWACDLVQPPFRSAVAHDLASDLSPCTQKLKRKYYVDHNSKSTTWNDPRPPIVLPIPRPAASPDASGSMAAAASSAGSTAEGERIRTYDGSHKQDLDW